MTARLRMRLNLQRHTVGHAFTLTSALALEGEGWWGVYPGGVVMAPHT